MPRWPTASTTRRAAAAVAAAVLFAAGVPGRPVAADTADDIAAVQERADRAAGRLAQLDAELSRLDDKLDALSTQRGAVAHRLDGLRGSLRGLALARYVAGTTDLTATLRFSLDDPNEAIVRTYLDEWLAGGRTDVLDDYRVTAEELGAADQALQAAHQRADDQRRRLDDERRVLDGELARLRTVQAQEAAAAAARAAAAAAAARDAAVRDAAARAAAATTAATTVARARAPVAKARRQASPTSTSLAPTPRAPAASRAAAVLRPAAPAGMVCPVNGATAFGDTFGPNHPGVDMMGSLGEPIVAVVSGTARHTHSPKGGNQVWLYGDNGVRYFYAHLSGYASAGRVGAGQVVGYMGSTGRTGVVHLHFEIRPGGSAVDPTPYVRSVC
jgi:murein DD-endopeptidase MepM/ murein hydrolase activator NlpD